MKTVYLLSGNGFNVCEIRFKNLMQAKLVLKICCIICSE